jgi:hypothetical protein
MEVLLIVLAVIAAGAALVYFMNSSMGMQLVRKKVCPLFSILFMSGKAQRLRLHSMRFTNLNNLLSS